MRKARVVTNGDEAGHRFRIGEEIEVSETPEELGVFYRAGNQRVPFQILEEEDFEVIED